MHLFKRCESKKLLFFAGEASVSTGVLQPYCGWTGSVSDESSLVLENHQRIDQNNLQGDGKEKTVMVSA